MRVPMVTRTVTSTKCVCLCINLETCEPYNDVVVIAREHKDDKLEKLVSESYDNETRKVVKILSKEILTDRYGMSETEFLTHASKIESPQATE